MKSIEHLWINTKVFKVLKRLQLLGILLCFKRENNGLAFSLLNQIFPPFSSEIAEKSMITVMKDNIIMAPGHNISSIHFISLKFHEPYLFGKTVFLAPQTIIVIMIWTCGPRYYGLILA